VQNNDDVRCSSTNEGMEFLVSQVGKKNLDTRLGE
jgi:hypothetical protein